jgi:putative membrane protein
MIIDIQDPFGRNTFRYSGLAQGRKREGVGRRRCEQRATEKRKSPVVGDDETGRGERGDAAAACEPDYRFTLANERTFLAWERTALGLLAAAVAVVQLIPDLGIAEARHVLGALLAVLATLTAGVGLRRWVQVDRAIRAGMPLPRGRAPWYVGVGLVVLGVFALLLVTVTAVIG